MIAPTSVTRSVDASPSCVAAIGTTCAPNSSRFDTQSGLAPHNGTNAKGSALVVSARMNDAWNFKSISGTRAEISSDALLLPKFV